DKLANTLLNKLSIDSLKMLKILSGMRLQGMELFEFIVKERAFDDIALLMQKISSYDDENFIYTLLGEVLDCSTIQQVMVDDQKLNKLMQDKPNLTNCNMQEFGLLFYNTKRFKEDIVKLIGEMNNSIFLNKLDSLKEDYSKHIEKTKIRVKDKKPMDVSQEIIEKQFKRKFDFREYYFIPSYFIAPHKIRVFCSDAQMVVFALEQKGSPINEVGDRISLVFKIISDRTRLEILRAIISKPTYGKLLAEKLNLTTATISHHVEVLKSVNLIKEKRIKNIKYFEANSEEIKKIFDEGLEYLFEK
ncbi:MAG TPA: winged helix-turn-helix domain-containing protein, partial [Methanosarcinales archaeon]|nr:winged helix-turn-helix domain-containing protein [Methanosarcinales archaeon]